MCRRFTPKRRSFSASLAQEVCSSAGSIVVRQVTFRHVNHGLFRASVRALSSMSPSRRSIVFVACFMA
jgi:hypothetical protein